MTTNKATPRKGNEPYIFSYVQNTPYNGEDGDMELTMEIVLIVERSKNDVLYEHLVLERRVLEAP